MDKLTVAVVKSETLVGHIMKGKTGRFSKPIFYFLKESTDHKCYVEITGKAVDHGDLKRMKVPCIIKFIGESHFIYVLTNDLQKHKGKALIENKYLTLS